MAKTGTVTRISLPSSRNPKCILAPFRHVKNKNFVVRYVGEFARAFRFFPRQPHSIMQIWIVYTSKIDMRYKYLYYIKARVFFDVAFDSVFMYWTSESK